MHGHSNLDYQTTKQSSQTLSNQIGNSSLSGKSEEEAEQREVRKVENSVSDSVFPLCSTIHQFYMFNYHKHMYAGEMRKNCKIFFR